jgi:hypothetical protein
MSQLRETSKTPLTVSSNESIVPFYIEVLIYRFLALEKTVCYDFYSIIRFQCDNIRW